MAQLSLGAATNLYLCFVLYPVLKLRGENRWCSLSDRIWKTRADHAIVHQCGDRKDSLWVHQGLDNSNSTVIYLLSFFIVSFSHTFLCWCWLKKCWTTAAPALPALRPSSVLHQNCCQDKNSSIKVDGAVGGSPVWGFYRRLGELSLLYFTPWASIPTFIPMLWSRNQQRCWDASWFSGIEMTMVFLEHEKLLQKNPNVVASGSAHLFCRVCACVCAGLRAECPPKKTILNFTHYQISICVNVSSLWEDQYSLISHKLQLLLELWNSNQENHGKSPTYDAERYNLRQQQQRRQERNGVSPPKHVIPPPHLHSVWSLNTLPL